MVHFAQSISEAVAPLNWNVRRVYSQRRSKERNWLLRPDNWPIVPSECGWNNPLCTFCKLICKKIRGLFFNKFRCSQDVSHLSDFHFPHIRLIWRSSRLLRKVEVGNITSTEIVLVSPNPVLNFQHFLRQTNQKAPKSFHPSISCETTLCWPDWYSARHSLNRSQYIDSATVPLFVFLYLIRQSGTIVRRAILSTNIRLAHRPLIRQLVANMLFLGEH